MPMGLRGGATITALALATTLGIAAPAGAATQLGQTTPGQPGGCNGNMDNVQVTVNSGASYEVPSAGVITSWSHRSNANPAASGRLQVWRRAGGTNYTLVGRSEAMIFTPDVLNTFATRIAVEAGDVLGFRVGATATGCGFPGGAGLGSLAAGPAGSADPAPGETRSLSTMPGLLNVAAVLEPDCDNDGNGDETQDGDLLSCPPGPNATITKAPKDRVKTKKKKQKVTFEFNASEPGATFNCVLDGKQEFKACTSPLKVKVKRGKHMFSVTATDTGGNAGAPATDAFKVKSKRKKR